MFGYGEVTDAHSCVKGSSFAQNIDFSAGLDGPRGAPLCACGVCVPARACVRARLFWVEHVVVVVAC